MGGQTALNLAIDCQDRGIWKKYGVKMIGVDINAIKVAEDRELFRQRMLELGIKVCKGKTAKSFLEGKEIAQEIGFPLVIRPSFTLGGSGGSFVTGLEDFEKKLRLGLHSSPIHEVLIEKSILGWKEFELELLRDGAGNIVIVCGVRELRSDRHSYRRFDYSRSHLDSTRYHLSTYAQFSDQDDGWNWRIRRWMQCSVCR